MPNHKKCCFVPRCSNSVENAPTKIFISVPYNTKIRKKWFQAVHRLLPRPNSRTHYYCCEDHFDLEEDMENYIKFKLMGGKIFMKPDVVPHIFECQPGRKQNSSKIRSAFKKRKNAQLVKEALAWYEENKFKPPSPAPQDMLELMLIEDEETTIKLEEEEIENVASPLQESSIQLVSELDTNIEDDPLAVEDSKKINTISSIEKTGKNQENYENETKNLNIHVLLRNDIVNSASDGICNDNVYNDVIRNDDIDNDVINANILENDLKSSLIEQNALKKIRKSSYYKWCFVPNCKNTSKKSPGKIFVNVPCTRNIRIQWFKAVNRSFQNLSYTYFCCEDHFDLEQDMENYLKFKLLGGKIKMKENVIPHKFDCQPERKRTVPNIIRSSFKKRKNAQLAREAMKKKYNLSQNIFRFRSLISNITTEINEQLTQETITQITQNTQNELKNVPFVIENTQIESLNEENYNNIKRFKPESINFNNFEDILVKNESLEYAIAEIAPTIKSGETDTLYLNHADNIVNNTPNKFIINNFEDIFGNNESLEFTIVEITPTNKSGHTNNLDIENTANIINNFEDVLVKNEPLEYAIVENKPLEYAIVETEPTIKSGQAKSLNIKNTDNIINNFEDILVKNEPLEYAIVETEPTNKSGQTNSLNIKNNANIMNNSEDILLENEPLEYAIVKTEPTIESGETNSLNIEKSVNIINNFEAILVKNESSEYAVMETEPTVYCGGTNSNVITLKKCV